jgi:methionyl-tRNA formyltransferase
MTQSFNLVFAGTPRFAVPTLESLAEAGHLISLVVTQPDRPRGRGMEVTASPVKQSALARNLPIAQPERIKNNPEFQSLLTAVRPDAIVVVGYGRLIPQWMIDLPRYGNLNVHASLLPKYRGAAPIQWAIAEGETVTGVTIMRIDAGLDTGDILTQQELSIDPDDTAETLAPRLATMGAALLVETLQKLAEDKIRPVPQDHSRATLAPILQKDDGRINFQRDATQIRNRLRGFQPWPGAFTTFRGKNLHLWSAQVVPLDSVPGRLRPAELANVNGLLLVGCGQETALELHEVQLEGKKRMSGQDFANGHRPFPGEKLGEAQLQA